VDRGGIEIPIGARRKTWTKPLEGIARFGGEAEVTQPVGVPGSNHLGDTFHEMNECLIRLGDRKIGERIPQVVNRFALGFCHAEIKGPPSGTSERFMLPDATLRECEEWEGTCLGRLRDGIVPVGCPLLMPTRSTRNLPTAKSAPAKSPTRLFQKRWLAVILAASGASTPALATDYTWTGTTNNTWATGTNWSTGTAPNGATAAIFFGTATNRTPNLAATASVGSLTFNVGGDAFTISRTSGTFSLASGGSVVNNSSNLQTISAPLTLSGSSTWSSVNGDLLVTGV